MTQTAAGARHEPTVAAPAPTCWPALKADDAPALIDFLVDVVGFRRTAVYTDADGARSWVAHAQLDWPEGGGVLMGSRRPTSGVAPGIAGRCVVTDHVDEVHDRVRDAPGVTITHQLTDTDHGNHEFVMTDPEGNYWSFGTYRGDAPDPA